MRANPIVAVSACIKVVDGFSNHAVGTTYVESLVSVAEVTPVILPALGRGNWVEDVLATCGGLYLTGSLSNIGPHHYGESAGEATGRSDPLRDATVLPVIRRAVSEGIPVFAICRGFQEMNVAFGGTLFQEVHEVPGYFDHREDRTRSPDEFFGPAHEVELAAGGLLAGLLDADRITVNSLHGQGVKELAPNLEVEARACDGLVEAFRVRDAGAFAVGVQWHPEWKATENECSRILFEAFGQACRERAMTRKAKAS